MIVFLLILILIALVFISCAVIPPVASDTTSKTVYERMVGASVHLGDENGFYSGAFIKDNVILTAAHCLEYGKTISIELHNGMILESDDFYIDEGEDVGFIFVEADELCIAELSDEPVELGDTVYAVGTPGQFEHKFTLMGGIVSNLSRTVPHLNWTDVFQIDIDGSAGMSGGPVYDADGKLVGMYVGQAGMGGYSISFCEDSASIERAYERYESK